MPDLPPPPSSPGAAERLRAVADAFSLTVPQLLARAVGGLAVAAIAVVVALAWRGSPSPPEDALPRAGQAGDPSPATTSSVDGPVYVHVAGAVARAGVYKVAANARVTDVLDAAGGPAPDADLDQLNLAAKLNDGERVYVPRRGEAPPPVVGAVGASAGTASSGPIDLNTATADQLDALPGVGPSTAKAILDYRTQHGRFKSVQELLEVRGIGDAKFADLRSKVRV